MQNKETGHYEELNNIDEVKSKSVDIENGKEQNNSSNFDNPTHDEINVDSVPSAVRNKEKRKNNRKFNPIVSIVAVVTAVVMAVALLPKTAPKISEVNSAVGGEYYAYSLLVDNPSEIELTLKVYNDYFESKQTVTSGEIKGLVEGLEKDTDYKIEVKGSQGFGTKTFYSAKFRTLKDSLPFATSVSVKYYNKDDSTKLYFKATINDFFGYYSGYKVYVEIKEFLKEIPINGNITDEQCLSLADIKAEKFTLIIKADTQDPKDIQNNVTNKIVYSASVTNKNAK